MFNLLLSQNSEIWRKTKEILLTTAGRVSSTELSSVLHLNPTKSKRALWQERKNGKNHYRYFGSPEACEHGHAWEQTAILQALAILSPFKPLEWAKPGIILDPLSPTCCSPDQIILEPHGQILGLEVKCPYTTALPKEPSEIPPQHLVQCLCCIHNSKARGWYLFYYSDLDPLDNILFFVLPNQVLWDTLVVPMVRDFLKQEKVPERKNKWDKKLGNKIIQDIEVYKIYSFREEVD